ncbi:MAG: type II secretion system F family protein [Proteobacteria bacterium]|nr:type II secretion system F family protein [Pseudomonadota bacterium]
MATAKKEVMFVWEGKDKQGKVVKGELAGMSDAMVKAKLRRQGVNPLKVKKKPKPLFGSGGGKAITPKDITIFSRQLATMMSAGVPLVQAFEIVGRGHENANMQELILGVKADVEAGNSLTDALKKKPLQFNELYCNLVEAGEHAGILEAILHKLATYMEKTEAIKSKIKAALFYPASVIVVAGIVVSILMIFVIPQFEELFSNFGADLPALTQMLITMSNFFVQWWWAMFAVIGGGIYGLLALHKRSKVFAQGMERIMLKLPILGVVLEKAAIARFARTLETMFAAGTPLVEAMVSVAGACGNIVFYNACMKIRDDISTGTQLQQAMRDTELFPNMVVQMVAIGEEAGSIDTMLGKVADWYEEEVDNAVDALTSLLEPAIMAFLGVVIGGIVIGMYLPIFKMGQVV